MMIRDNLRDAIKNSGMIVKDISQKSGVSKRTIDKWIGAESVELRANDFVKVCRALNVSPERIVFGDILGQEYSDDDLAYLANKYKDILYDLDNIEENVRESIIAHIKAVAMVRKNSMEAAEPTQPYKKTAT